MKPTTKLRFIIKMMPSPQHGENISTPTKVLQQWWDATPTVNLGWTGEMPIGETIGEWRDVPLEEQA